MGSSSMLSFAPCVHPGPRFRDLHPHRHSSLQEGRCLRAGAFTSFLIVVIIIIIIVAVAHFHPQPNGIIISIMLVHSV